MDKKFILEKFGDRYIIFPTSAKSSLSDKEEIKKLVRDSKVWEGTILIDMLLIRGDKLNRFIEVMVKFGDVRGLQMTYGEKREVRDFCFQFYRKNFEMVENSNLRPFLQKKMKKNKYF
jgi:hypothetical protein